MNRTAIQSIKTLACGAAITVTIACATARAQVVVQEGYPPPEYIATTQPVYFEGRPAYFWNNHWYYRMGNGWGFYREEPGFLHDWRAHNHPPPPRFYEGHYGPGPHGPFHRR